MVHQLFERFKDLHILVVGDVMLDVYRWGQVDRVSPEAPVPVVRIRNTEHRLGGAANVALNCHSLGAKVSLATVIGEDEAGDQLLSLLNQEQVLTDLVHRNKERSTTSKTRIISRSQQMIRLDEENTSPLSIPEEHSFIDSCLRYLQIQKPDLVIFEDYNKGVLKENVIKKIIAHCKVLRIPVAVDPKHDNFLAYEGVDIFKPNLNEVLVGLQVSMTAPTIENLQGLHAQLKERLQHRITLITLSDKGVYFADTESNGIIPAHLRSIADVSGAGDTVIAVAAMVYVLTKDVRLMASYANIAGGLVCEVPGVVPINKEKLLQEISQLET